MSEQGLLRDIIDHPADDGLRLILADWLQDHGDEARAEFIRLQVRYHRLGRDRDQQLYDALGWRAADILEMSDWGDRLLGGAYTILDFGYLSPDYVPSVRFRRGFVAEVRCRLSTWRRHGPALAARHPVERVEAVDVKIVGRRTLRCETQWAASRGRRPEHLYGPLVPPWPYPSRELAQEALSARLIAWARSATEATEATEAT